MPPASASSTIERERPDLLLVDGRLGDDVLGSLLGRPQGPDRPGVIVLTSAESAGRLERLLRERADDFVDAGLAPRELVARVQVVLRLRGMRRELAAKSAEVVRLSARLEGIAGRMAEELRLASHVQRTLLPPPLVHPRLDLAAEYLPVREIGGDYYDVIPLEGGRLALALGDVMGKGVPAALLAANLKSCLRAHVQAGQLPPDETLVRVNRLFREVIPKGLFATLLFAVLDWRAGVVEYVNAGHEPGLLLRRDGSLVELDSGRDGARAARGPGVRDRSGGDRDGRRPGDLQRRADGPQRADGGAVRARAPAGCGLPREARPGPDRSLLGARRGAGLVRGTSRRGRPDADRSRGCADVA